MFRRRVLVTLLPVAFGLALAGTLGQASEPSALAIRNARIIPVSGPAIDQGTIVMSRGLITAIGANVDVPAGAWVIDGKGLTVYPGLIDALTDLGLTTTTPAPGGAARPGGGGAPVAATGPVSRGPRDRPQSTPWVQAADDIKPDDRRIENWRNAGFTTALTAPRTGLFPGQGAVINLAGERAGDLVIASPVTLQVNLQPTGGFGGGFPGSLMGGIAYVRQVFLDVQHDSDVRKQYDAAPRGLERPEYDRTIRAVADAQAANRAVLMPATTAVQIQRVLDLAQELKLKPVVYGVHEGYRIADRLAARKTPALVSLKWPEKDSTADPDADESLRTLRFRDKAPSTPAALQKAGVRFAFYSDGAQPQDLVKNARKAVDAGLPADAALKALTLDAAEILGVATRLGSLDTGKIANLVVTDGDLFNEKTKVKLVFVDGQKFEVRDAPAPARPGNGEGRGGPPPTAAEGSTMTGATMTGKWTLAYSTPQGAQTATADLTMGSDGALTGSLTSHLGTSPITSGSLTGSKFSFNLTVTTQNGPMAVTFSGTLDGNSVKGTVSAGTNFSTEFTGTRPSIRSSDSDDDEDAAIDDEDRHDRKSRRLGRD